MLVVQVLLAAGWRQWQFTTGSSGENRSTPTWTVEKSLRQGLIAYAKGLDRALGMTAYHDEPEVLKVLLDHGAKVTEVAVLGASNSENVPMLQHLLDHGRDVNSLASQSPALRLVVSNEECTRFLLENGADPNLPG
ncbi:uncharacterized protein KD926_007340 [Aspergillus affinis]|uniref:uncharacterized protein n=1 Tax=Aspergillus affinis TaxID=1070780 RepID=UPI0022FE05A7|nr:uncharacterized protein KD926_007340 [Aspergillus affinis]KAI9041071.1 hypothetical protein KD926_007340 [Aspergillus affinis]